MNEELRKMKEEYVHELIRYYREKGISKESIETIDMMVHTLKNLCKIIGEEDNYSMRGMSYDYDHPHMSFARQRDSMGRYSGDHDLVNGLRDLMNRTADEHSRRELQDMINRVEMR